MTALSTPNAPATARLSGACLLVLNYNGRALLEDCLLSLMEAARRSRYDCVVEIVDNASTDDSLTWLAATYPQLRVWREPNRGLCSYNRVLAQCTQRVAVLLNNDIRLAPGAVDPLIEPLLGDRATPLFMTAPLCWRRDGVTYEGLKTSVRWRWGFVQATALFDGNERARHIAGQTASAGAVMAVDRARFLELGGFDPLYLPGRIEDLDLAYRAYQSGYECRYVPESVAYHLGQATFEREYQAAGCLDLALRNTLLFQWKHLRHPRHLVRQLSGLSVRLIFDVLRAWRLPPARRMATARALLAAWRRHGECLPAGSPRTPHAMKLARERQWFLQFHPNVMARA